MKTQTNENENGNERENITKRFCKEQTRQLFNWLQIEIKSADTKTLKNIHTYHEESVQCIIHADKVISPEGKKKKRGRPYKVIKFFIRININIYLGSVKVLWRRTLQLQHHGWHTHGTENNIVYTYLKVTVYSKLFISPR